MTNAACDPGAAGGPADVCPECGLAVEHNPTGARLAAKTGARWTGWAAALGAVLLLVLGGVFGTERVGFTVPPGTDWQQQVGRVTVADLRETAAGERDDHGLGETLRRL